MRIKTSCAFSTSRVSYYLQHLLYADLLTTFFGEKPSTQKSRLTQPA